MPRQRNPVKTLTAALSLLVLIATLGAGMTKAYYVTPMKLDDHEMKIRRLEERDAEFSKELRDQRDILLEIRGDIKVIRSRNTPLR